MKLRKRLGLPDRDFATLTNEELNAIAESAPRLSWRHSLVVKELMRRPKAKPRKYKKTERRPGYRFST